MRKEFLIFMFILIAQSLFGQQFTDLYGDYLGQTPPGNTPVLFAPGFVSLENRMEYFITFSPDGKECYFTIDDANGVGYIMETIYSDSAWTVPQKTSFAKSQSICPSISPDGTKLFFSSPVTSSDDRGIYQCQRTDSGWSAPVEMNREVSSRVFESSCRLSDKGNFYVCSWRSGGKGGCDGWRIPYINGVYKKAENLGLLNSSDGDCHWAPGPNESYLIWNSRRPLTGETSAFYRTDLFISYSKPNGGWTCPRNLGPKINSTATDMGAWISQDGKYLFFSSDRRGAEGDNDIYWVSTNFIDSLKNTNFSPYVNRAISNQAAKQGSLFNYQIPDSTFIDDDGNNTLTFSAALNNGNPLPSWLNFNTKTATFSGVPDTIGTFRIKVTATDTAKESASCVFAINVKSSPVGIEEKNGQLPRESKLYQNYPNPFNPTTTIKYDLLKDSRVKIIIYDILGREVTKLVDEIKRAGSYKVTLDAACLTSGVFFTRFKPGIILQ
jgi:hypothetical protein